MHYVIALGGCLLFYFLSTWHNRMNLNGGQWNELSRLKVNRCCFLLSCAYWYPIVKCLGCPQKENTKFSRAYVGSQKKPGPLRVKHTLSITKFTTIDIYRLNYSLAYCWLDQKAELGRKKKEVKVDLFSFSVHGSKGARILLIAWVSNRHALIAKTRYGLKDRQTFTWNYWDAMKLLEEA